MASNQRKEDEKNEKIIRGLLKLAPNRRCINCNSLGPQYVCTSFQTFVCTTCSGVHREFTHRIKSVSMAKFTSDEVAALKEGGNERARKIFFKVLDPQRYPLPDSSNIERLRSFIKDVYVYRRYACEVTRVKSGNIDNSYENGKVGAHLSGSCGSSFEDAHAHRYDERYRPIERSSSERSSKHAYRRNSVHFEVVDSRFRDNRPRNNKTSEDQKVLDVGSMTMSRVPGRNSETSVGEISRENVPTFCIGDSAWIQKNETSNSPMSNDEKPVESKGVNIINLIDFDVDPQPPDAVEGPSAQPSSTPTDRLTTQCDMPSVNGDYLASLDFITQRATSDSQASLSSRRLRSVSSPVLASLSETVSSAPFTDTDRDQYSIQPRDPENANTIGSMLSSLSTNIDAQSPQQFSPSIEGAVDSQELQTVSTAKSCQATSRPAEHTSAEVETQLSSVEAKSSGRKELPENLFTASYSSTPGPVLGWQTGALQNMPFGAQYNPQRPLLNIPHSPSSANPFDRSHAQMFPSYGSLQGALPNMTARQGILRTSSLGNLSSQYITQYPAAQSPPFLSVAPLNMHMVQQVPCNLPASVTQRFSGYGGQGAAFISSNSNQELSHGSSLPSTPNSFTRTGNPFS